MRPVVNIDKCAVNFVITENQHNKSFKNGFIQFVDCIDCYW